MDKRQVLMITSVSTHNTSFVLIGENNRKEEEDTFKPNCIIAYNAAKKLVFY